MAKVTFNKKRNNNPKPVDETHISKPEKIYNFEDDNNLSKNKESLKSRKKVYSTIRVQRERVHELNALQNSLGFDTQDEFLKYLLDKEKENLTDRQRTMFNMYMDTYEARDRRKK